jgi:hypothetical protein
MRYLIVILLLSACTPIQRTALPKPTTIGECLQQRGMFPGGFANEGVGGYHMDYYAAMSCEVEVDQNRRAHQRAQKHQM